MIYPENIEAKIDFTVIREELGWRCASSLGRDLMPGERVYLAPKKTTGSKEFVWTHTGQSLWKLSQEEGVQIEAILKYNELDPKIRTFRTRQKIYLKKVKEPK